MSFGRQFPTHGGLYGLIWYLARHGVEISVQRRFEASFLITTVLETGVQYMLDKGFQIKTFWGTGVKYF